jgi:hypothetical protein
MLIFCPGNSHFSNAQKAISLGYLSIFNAYLFCQIFPTDRATLLPKDNSSACNTSDGWPFSAYSMMYSKWCPHWTKLKLDGVVPRSQEKYAVGQKKMDDTYLLLLQRMMP